jgi:UDP-glucose 4-epimerase
VSATRALITGGAGLVGSHIADGLVRDGISEVVVVDNFTRGRADNLSWALANGNVTTIEGDIRERGLLERLMPGIDVVFHQAAIRITQCAEEPRLAMEVLADGTFNVLDAAVRGGVRKVVLASSASIYGLADSFPTNETHPPYRNRTLYGAAKAFSEGMARSFHEMYGLDYVALRYFNVYGPRMDIHGAYTEVLIRWMEAIEGGEPPLILGDGGQTMDFVHVSDVARANLLAARSRVTDEVFNVGRGEETSLHELATTLLRVMGSELGPRYGPERTVNAVPRRLSDTSKARRMLGFQASIGLEAGLIDLVRWWRAERTGASLPGAGTGDSDAS